jgi:hypothetical protein
MVRFDCRKAIQVSLQAHFVIQLTGGRISELQQPRKRGQEEPARAYPLSIL